MKAQKKQTKENNNPSYSSLCFKTRICKTHETQEEGRPNWILPSFLDGGTKYAWKKIQRQGVEQRLKE
jgi:hypothetical protein